MKSLTALTTKPGFSTSPQVYLRAGSALLVRGHPFLLINFNLSGFICNDLPYSLFYGCDVSESWQDIIQARPSRFPISAQELFGILDVASENTFLCGTAGLMQKYIFDGEAGKIGLETKNLVACTSFLVEQILVPLWVFFPLYFFSCM